MITFSLTAAARTMIGQLAGADAIFTGVSTDSRTLRTGELFVALQGERHDGHDAIALAHAAGATGAVIDRPLNTTLPTVRVGNTRRALGQLAHAWRACHNLPVIGVTGSSGKTTTKEMITAILRQDVDVLATMGNLNNDIGVPLTLFRLALEHRAAVIEMGANGMRDIAELVEIAQPTIGLVTMCGPAHLQGFGSIEQVAEAKGAIYQQLGPSGLAVLNADDQFCHYWRRRTDAGRVLTFGITEKADYYAENIRLRDLGQGSEFDLCAPEGRIRIRLPLEGRHNIRNALAAAAAALHAGSNLEAVAAGLGQSSPVNGRLNVRTGLRGCVIIDDTYNANPASLAAALSVLAGYPARRWLVLGDMAELGSVEHAEHLAAGLLARQQGVERLFTLGTLSHDAVSSFGTDAVHYPDRASLVAALQRDVREDIAILIKGSRVMQLEKVVDALVTQSETTC